MRAHSLTVLCCLAWGGPAFAQVNGVPQASATVPGVATLGAPGGSARLGPNGGLALTPTSDPTQYGELVSRALTGTSSAGLNGSLHNVTGDTVAVTGANFLSSYTIQHAFGGTATQGGRQGLYSLLTQTSPTSASNANRNYVSSAFNVTTQSGDGGTNTTTGALGAYFAINPVAVAAAGATNLYELTAGEANVALQTGASAKIKAGFSIISLVSDAVHGSVVDAKLLMSDQAGSVGWNDGVLFTDSNGKFPIASTGSVMRATAGTVAAGINLSALTITGYAWASPGAFIDGAGNYSGGNLTLTGSVLINNGVPITIKSSAGYAGGTSGTALFTSGTSAYLDVYDTGGALNFRGPSYASWGSLSAAGLVTAGPLRSIERTVASLPACTSSTAGARANVSDATASSYGQTLVGGGAYHAPAYCNSANWIQE